MTDKDKAVIFETCVHLNTQRVINARMKMLIAKALSCSKQRQRPSETWEAEALALLRVLEQDRKEKTYV